MQTKVNKLRYYGITEDNYEKFKDFINNKKSLPIHSTYELCDSYLNNLRVGDRNRIKHQLELWNQYNLNKLKLLDGLENKTINKLNKELLNLNKYNELLDVRVSSLGHLVFSEIDLDVKCYEINVTEPIDNIGVDELLVKLIMEEIINKLVSEKLIEIVEYLTSDNLNGAIKMLVDNLMLESNDDVIKVTLSIGIGDVIK